MSLTPPFKVPPNLGDTSARPASAPPLAARSNTQPSTTPPSTVPAVPQRILSDSNGLSGSKGLPAAQPLDQMPQLQRSGPSIVKTRTGSVLSRGLILKTDHYPSGIFIAQNAVISVSLNADNLSRSCIRLGNKCSRSSEF